ncbi:MAG: hypothetical protein UHK44_05640, partial [Bacteroidaceae bacterium]|nr:hypothetical protein [Bacteroidaceae bacterium]
FLLKKDMPWAKKGYAQMEEQLKLQDAVKSALLADVAKSDVKVWECRNCGHIVVGEKAPEICPTCAHPQAYFEIHIDNY